MAKFALITTYSSDTDKRLALRPAHRDYLRSLAASGNLLHAGPFADEIGSLVIFEAESKEQVEGFIAADPFTKEGIFASVSLREWNRVLP